MTSTAHEQLAYEKLARLRKAIALADLCDASSISSALAQGATDADWALCADQCDPPVRMPSAETQRLVVELLAAREKARERMVRK